MRSSALTITLIATIIVSAFAATRNAIGANWTGLIIYVGNPRAAWNGTSDCVPCNAICSDLSDYAEKAGGWRIGFTQYRNDGTPNHIAIMRSLPGEATPYVEAVRDGNVIATSTGYQGKIQAVIDIYPGPKMASVKQSARAARANSYAVQSSDWQVEAQYEYVQTYGYGPGYRYSYAPSISYSYRNVTPQSYGPIPYTYSNQFLPQQQTPYRGVCVNGICY